MSVIQGIRQKMYESFHPSIECLMREFAIVEEPITQEEYEKCMKLIDEFISFPVRKTGCMNDVE